LEQMPVKTSPKAAQKAKPPRTVVVRIWDWAAWARQIVRGVQQFAHDHPHWRVYVDPGQKGGMDVRDPELAVDGIITHVIGDTKSWQRLYRERRIKVVCFSSGIPAFLADLPRVQVQESRMARTIGQHLLDGGFRRLVYFGGAGRKRGFEDIRARELIEFARSKSIPIEIIPNPQRRVFNVTSHFLRRSVAKLAKPTGIVAWNMDLARRIVLACRDEHITIPEQLAVVSWDDDPMIAETVRPTISGAVVPADRQGYEAARLLESLMNGAPPSPVPVLVEPSGVLHVRQSSDVSSLKDREVFLAQQYIREHAAEPLKVSQIAYTLGISRKKLELDFRRVANITPYEAIVNARLAIGKQLLLETEWPTTKVAKQCGMGDEATLRRWLVRDAGMTPGEYRRRFTAVQPPPDKPQMPFGRK
jgi:LacI family transcriptional regulator